MPNPSLRTHRARKTTRRRVGGKPRGGRRWSAEVMRKSDAMDLEGGVFKKKDPTAIAKSLKRSAERSHRRKSPPFRSAMSMLSFYLNRGGKNLDGTTKRRLSRAKEELRRLYGKA